MFARSYFPGVYFPPAYYPPNVALVEVEYPARVGGGGYWDYEPVYRKIWAEALPDDEILELIPIFMIVIEDD
jgi:hypothetical protein